ncbi:hypothetical protein ACH3VR_15375 [Microbacterium sp. B2969]|uniref:DUF222 domain-containing protein n=1 Tax=Microbacterium alkaliflavum TaxID=3248839 RepID=A0ABW7QBK9_9MICO
MSNHASLLDEEWLPPIPDPVDLVVETDAMVSVMLAERYRRVDAMRRDALADAASRGYRLNEVIERGVRLELACAMRITEHAAGLLLCESDALVNRYPTVPGSLGGARITQRHATDLVAALEGVESEFRDRILGPGLTLAESLPVGTFRRKLQKLVETVRAATLSERFGDAVQARRVCVENLGDGVGALHWHGPMVDIRAA